MGLAVDQRADPDSSCSQARAVPTPPPASLTMESQLVLLAGHVSRAHAGPHPHRGREVGVAGGGRERLEGFYWPWGG